MKTTINTKNLCLPATVELNSSKVVLTGGNGAGKTTLLSALAAAYTGKGLGGADMALLSPTGKPSVDVFVDGKRIMVGDKPLFDLRTLGTMTGPARADYLFGLLGGNVTKEQIIEAIHAATPAHLLDAVEHVAMAKDVDAAIKLANAAKLEADRSLDGLRAMSRVTIEMDASAVRAEIARMADIVSDKFAVERGRIVAEGQKIAAELGDKKDLDPSEVFSKLSELRGEETDLSDMVKVQQDVVNTAAGKLSALRLMVNQLKGSDHCPTCKQRVEATLLDTLKNSLAAVEAEHAAAERDLKAMRYDLSSIQADITTGEALTKLLCKLHDLRNGLETLPKGEHTATQVIEAREHMEELKSILAQHEQIASASAQIAKVEEEAKTFRAIEAALKNLKAVVARTTGFPARVETTVHEVLNYTLGFGKVGSRMDITVTSGELTRPITTLSAGEWQVVAAAFGLMEPDAVVLVEAAEIDDQHFVRLAECLLSQDGLVVIADWRNRQPNGYEVVEVASE